MRKIECLMIRKTPILKQYVPYTIKDADGIPASVFYVPPVICNLNCYHCHNKNSNYGNYFFTVEELEKEFDKLILLGIEAFIISGGEPLLIKDKIPFSIFSEARPTRVDTNGTLPDAVKQISPFAQGFAVDVKIPVREKYSEEEKERYQKILYWGKAPLLSVEEYAARVKETLFYLAENPMPLNLTRTVKYPLLKEEEVEEIREFVSELKLKHQVNPFYPIEEA